MHRTTRFGWLWLAVLVLLVCVRIPSLVQPAGGDQGLYGYAGQRVLAGDVMYLDMWDQKPPAIAFVYALLWMIWPDEAMVPAADLAVAAAVAVMLVLLGRRRFSLDIGCGAAAVFLLFGDPYLQRLSGVYVRAQCEPFIALSVTTSLLLLSHPARGRARLIAAGLALGLAFWLKYNALAYALPVLAAVWVWRPAGDGTLRQVAWDAFWVVVGFLLLALVVVGYFAVHGAVTDLWLATIDYNLRYSNETYEGPWSRIRYLATFPLIRARVDMLWFLGALGALLLAWRKSGDRSTLLVFVWLAAAMLSIAINGSRSLPNYFVQAAPVLGLAASAGLATLAGAGRATRWIVGLLLLAGAWRVGADVPVAGLRLAGLPGLVDNVRYDMDHVFGRTDRDTYLQRFHGQKHHALENEKLVRYVRDVTAPDEPIFVFGFSGGSVGWKSERRSSSRFFWSRPVTIGFAAEDPSYGSAGLLRDLRHRPPALVALQKEEWRSQEYFMTDAGLRSWLLDSYVLDHETPWFSVWRPRR